MKKRISFVAIGLLCFCVGYSQKNDTLKILFYNVENLFDTFDDSTKNDNEFLPNSEKEWDYFKFQKKLTNIYQVIASTGWQEPDLIGLSEVENRYCLNQLLLKTPLVNASYEIVHFESPDKRGIDVALLYNELRLTLISAYPVGVDLSSEGGGSTRDILYASFTNRKYDTLHVLVNHWPSRRGGAVGSEPNRLLASNVLFQATDSILKRNSNANIIAMGDFNDNPNDQSIVNLEKLGIVNMCSLYNYYGTLKYKGRWEVFDQFLVSPHLHSKYSVLPTILHYPYLLMEESKSNLGYKPYRTYAGPHYLGGFSDHLPVLLKIF